MENQTQMEIPVKEVQMPVNKMHWSMMSQLCRNPLIFKLKYILGIYDSKMGMSGMVGKAGHKALEYYDALNHAVATDEERSNAIAQAIEIGMNFLNDYDDNFIEYGKTGSREKMLKIYTQAMQFYFAEEPQYHKIVAVEQKLEAEIRTVDGDLLPLPAVGVPDLVHERKDGGIEIIDRKFVKSFTDYESEDYMKIIQGQFYWHLVKASLNLNADRILFREIKITENTKENAGKPQIRDYAIPFSHEQYRIIFYNLFKDVVEFLKNPKAVYLPNLSDPFDGEQAGLLYAQGLISADISDVEVMHKVKDVAFQSKRFVNSRLERVENKNLPPEERIKMRLAEFGVLIEPAGVKVGPTVTQYQFKVSAGIRMSVFEKHKADIAQAVEAPGELRILAPIPGTSLVGVEVANVSRGSVELGPQHFVPNTLSIPVGIDVHGETTKVSLAEMPHLLIAGSTGSGKSILLHSIITALTEQMPASKMSLVLIDPKRVELRAFRKLPHLLGGKVLFEYIDAVKILEKLVNTMEHRYEKLEAVGCRDIGEYNQNHGGRMKYIVVVIDEFADLIYRSKNEVKKAVKKNKKTVTRIKNVVIEENESSASDLAVEDHIVRLAQMARAVGIHLIIATQRPSVDVITGLIKANFPTRIALTTASPVDSTVILGEPGAEKLAGKGDMLFVHPGGQKVRLQGFLTKKE